MVTFLLEYGIQRVKVGIGPHVYCYLVEQYDSLNKFYVRGTGAAILAFGSFYDMASVILSLLFHYQILQADIHSIE